MNSVYLNFQLSEINKCITEKVYHKVFSAIEIPLDIKILDPINTIVCEELRKKYEVSILSN